MENIDLIIGIHSIAEALNNPERKFWKIIGTKEGLSELRKRAGKNLEKAEVKLLAPHDFQQESQKMYKEQDFDYQRIVSGVLLACGPLPELDPSWIMDRLSKGEKLRLICLDQVTDVHNAAAIFRTAAFYGVQAIIISVKGNFGRSPSFARIASGSLEHVRLIKSASLPRTLTTLKEKNVACVGLSEHSDATSVGSLAGEGGICLVMGAEDKGLSNAVERILDFRVALEAYGPIKTLNVSVAAALAMEKFLK